MQPLNRIEPVLPAQAYKTYAIRSPLSTHFRPGTCEEAGCAAHRNGWTTAVDEATELGQKQAHYIRGDRTRRHVESKTQAGLTQFVFEAGQKCFAPHQVSLQRPENFLVLGGDHRGNPMRVDPYRHSRPEFWVEDFGEHQDRLKNTLERG